MTTTNRKSKEKNKINHSSPLWKCVNSMFLVLIISSVGFYLFNISQLATQGFVLRELKFEANLLAAENSELNEEFNFAQSYYALNSRISGLNMVEVSSFDSIKIGSTVAKK